MSNIKSSGTHKADEGPNGAGQRHLLTYFSGVHFIQVIMLAVFISRGYSVNPFLRIKSNLCANVIIKRGKLSKIA
ncbi:hypothetical protein [Oceanobacillus polygoni]|uniref:Uncharacterized protein n=1 Tax=Oceanobacillus polygoni TaxID=1235259 RepID=A0A9X1CFZ7_9BACI|nr:hypothetical protein [Oceanobacillus polygoni]MBP2077007.1 hypothetical protein [Oceanobacillus polygoni]